MYIAALHVINIIKDYNKKGQLEHKLSELSLQKYAVNEFCSRLIQLNNLLENKEYKDIPKMANWIQVI
jgi:hypothetical protein